jgi:hypothetical protein
MTARILMEIDYAAMRKEICSRCAAPFLAHFQPPADADKTLAANWCPNHNRTGFTSMTFRRQATAAKLEQSKDEAK